MEDKWIKLARECQAEEAILGARNTPENLATVFHKGQAAMIEDTEGIIAFAAAWDTPDPNWLELGSFWVSPAHRGHGLSSRVFHQLLEKFSDHHLMIITHVAKVIHLCHRAQWVQATADTWGEVPLTVTCGPCDVCATEAEKRACTRLADPEKCNLFFRKSTAT